MTRHKNRSRAGRNTAQELWPAAGLPIPRRIATRNAPLLDHLKNSLENGLRIILIAGKYGALFIGGFLKSYMTKKGENLATHEDIDKLVEQVSAVTKARKEIEAKISGDVWDRQKRWDMKREVLFEAARRVSDLARGPCVGAANAEDSRAVMERIVSRKRKIFYLCIKGVG